MPNNNYTRGRAFEYRVRDFFRKRYYYVVRSAKSSFPDLLVLSPDGHSSFIECKTTRGTVNDPMRLLSEEEKNRALELIVMYRRPFYLFFREGIKMRAVELFFGEGGIQCSSEMNISRWS